MNQRQRDRLRDIKEIKVDKVKTLSNMSKDDLIIEAGKLGLSKNNDLTALNKKPLKELIEEKHELNKMSIQDITNELNETIKNLSTENKKRIDTLKQHLKEII